jgi:hypothetical protein
MVARKEGVFSAFHSNCSLKRLIMYEYTRTALPGAVQ